MATLLPVNASSPERAETMARDAFTRTDLAADIVLDALVLDHVEPVRPFDRVGLQETGRTPVACYVFSVEFHRADR